MTLLELVISAWLWLISPLWVLLAWGAGRVDPRHRLEPLARPGQGPARVVVPARDEAAVIAGCVSAVRASRGVEFTLTVVDDGSSDGTAAHATAAAEGDPRVRVLEAAPKPAGWAGKCWALDQAWDREAADPAWWAFVDADVRLHPDALASLIARAEADGADAISAFGTWRRESLWERLAIPAIGWFIRGFADPDRVASGERPFANGQLLLVRGAAYRAVGGHASVRGQVLDDVGLARILSGTGFRLALVYAPWAFEVRLYDGLPAIVAGYRKNLLAGVEGRRGALFAASLGVAATTLAPPLIALGALAAGSYPLAAHAAALYAAMVVMRARLERFDGGPAWIAPAHPLGAAVLAWVLLAAAWGGEVRWRGRVFEDGVARE